MILVNETNMDPEEFLARRQFWIGESNKKKQHSLKNKVKEGGRIKKRKLLRSVIHSIRNSLSDDNIINCNRLFWQNNNVSGGSDSARVWDIAKALGVTF